MFWTPNEQKIGRLCTKLTDLVDLLTDLADRLTAIEGLEAQRKAARRLPG